MTPSNKEILDFLNEYFRRNAEHVYQDEADDDPVICILEEGLPRLADELRRFLAIKESEDYGALLDMDVRLQVYQLASLIHGLSPYKARQLLKVMNLLVLVMADKVDSD